MAVITISRQRGAGGAEIALDVAARLKATYFDHEILSRAAQMVQMPESALSQLDERATGWAERLVGAIALAFSPSDIRREGDAGARPPSPGRQISDVRFLHATRIVIRQLAEQGGAVIVGRGAQVLLRDRPDVLHVRVIAPTEDRAARLMEREGIGKEAAEDLIEDADENARTYLRRFYGVDWTDPSLYHLVLNTAKLSHDEAADLLVHLAHRVDKKQVGEALSVLAPHDGLGGVQLAREALRRALAGPVDGDQWFASVRMAHDRLQAELDSVLRGKAGAVKSSAARDLGQALSVLARLGAR